MKVASIAIAYLACGALAQVAPVATTIEGVETEAIPTPTTPVPPPPAPTPPTPTAPGPSDLPELGLAPEGGADASECPADGVLNPSDQPLPQYYISFGALGGDPLPGWTEFVAGTSVNGVTVAPGNVGTPAKGSLDILPGPVLSEQCVLEELFKGQLFTRAKGGLTLTFQVPDNIPYDVNMYFAETFLNDTSPATRVFDISVNGATFFQGLDVRASATGANKPLKQVAPAVVGNAGVITITLTPTTPESDPFINAIEVFPQGQYRSGAPGTAVDRNALISAIFAQFYALLGENEFYDPAADAAAGTITATPTTSPVP